MNLLISAPGFVAQPQQQVPLNLSQPQQQQPPVQQQQQQQTHQQVSFISVSYFLRKSGKLQ